MKGNSNTEPNRLEQIGVIFQVIWNIVRNDRITEGETIESWDYDYVNCTAMEHGAIIRAIMRDRYPLIDDEIAVINNRESNEAEFEAYQQYRELAKKIANEILS